MRSAGSTLSTPTIESNTPAPEKQLSPLENSQPEQDISPSATKSRIDSKSHITQENGNRHILNAQKKLETTESEKQVSDPISISSPENFTIESDSLGEGGAKTKFKNNITAIEMLKTLEKENRPATLEEKEILSQYVGWGGLQAVFDGENNAWSNEYAQLKEVLTDKEYNAARASTLDSFYTPPIVIDKIYEALNHFGFQGGNILEPAMGIGNFFGRMPEDMQNNSQLYGVEIDSISGRIAQKIYSQADIQIKGFENTDFQNGCFDIAIGNVPFGNLGFTDKKYGTKQLHDFFFAKTMDTVKEGGIIAFITSTGTLDKGNEDFRRQLAEKTDLIGAIRLPSGTFSKNAGTDVTSDIIFLQKRSTPPEHMPDWVHLGQTSDGLPVNKYFEQHPEMVLGNIVEGNKLYGRKNNTMCIPFENADLSQQLQDAVQNLHAEISAIKATEPIQSQQSSLAAPEKLRNYSLFFDQQSGNVCMKEPTGSIAWNGNNSKTKHDRAIAFIQLRDATRDILQAQEENCSDAQLAALQSKLNTLYDNFYEKYGLLHSRYNKSCFAQDVSYPLVCSLEAKFDKDKLLAKSDLFTKRTIKPPEPITHVDTAQEALALSMSEKACVDAAYMSQLTDMTPEEVLGELCNNHSIFPVPELSSETHIAYQEASEYLSGDIRTKLEHAELAAQQNPVFAENPDALKQVMPEPLKAGDIDIKLGATWIDPKYYQQFMYETFGTPKSNQVSERNPWVAKFLGTKSREIALEYAPVANQWEISNKTLDCSVNATQTFGTKRCNAYQILENMLNLRDTKVYQTVSVNGEEKRIIDLDATRAAQRKATKIQDSFQSWIFKDPQRRNLEFLILHIRNGF